MNHFVNAVIKVIVQLLIFLFVFNVYALQKNTAAIQDQLTVVTRRQSVDVVFDLLKEETFCDIKISNLSLPLKSAFVLGFTSIRYAAVYGSKSAADLLFINERGEILKVVTNAVYPFIYTCETPASAVVVFKSGFLKQHSVKKDDLIIFKRFRLSGRSILKTIENSKKKVRSLLLKNVNRYKHGYYDAGLFFQGVEDYQQAVNYYKMAFDKYKTPKSLNSLAMAYAKLGKLDLAAGTFAKLIDLFPEYREGYKTLFSFLVLLHKSEMAFNMYTQAITKYPELIFLKVQLAAIYIKYGRLESADKLLNSIDLSNEKDDSDLRAEFLKVNGSKEVRTGDFKKAAVFYRDYLKIYPFCPGSIQLRLFVLKHL